ncbi:(Fe-S)-binding protein [Archaeoglobus neptunius]|uniref:(Fe-S)-binding protein n=1 Tax=Archaeoglobus neptunius TaxID=2798580 RepID=UPI00192600DB|nr:(Fe-S)-binding protein [Archaeoglobus neptunius]
MVDYIFNFISFEDFSEIDKQLVRIRQNELSHLPFSGEPDLTEPNPEWGEKYVTELDGYIAIDVPWKPQTKEEEEELVNKFLSGLRKLLDKESNWTFLQPLLLSLEYCARCQTCSEACPIYIASGRKEIYNPNFRSEILRKIIKETKGGKKRSKKVNAKTITRLAELSYRCTICRRCTQTCPIGVDNGLITREIRKLFSQELGIAPTALHKSGTVQHLEKGSSTGLTPEGFSDIIEFIEEDIEERTGKKIKIPVDEKGADILLIHNAGEYLSWPENVAAFAIIFEEAGLDWTLSSDMVGYDAVNYGVWYDDVQLSRIALKHAEIAHKLDVNRIVVGECGHAHKAITVIADRIFVDEYNIPRESCLPLLWDIVRKKKLNLDPEKNNFPVTLHDPCNVVRLMGIVEPQRRILNEICPQFREMHPNGVYNYCCGGGSGFAIMNSMNFPEFRAKVASRMKLKQILDAFQDHIEPDVQKYVCAPCSNCKGAIRDILTHYNVTEKCGIYYGGLVELIVNAMVDVEEPFVEMY